jgi:hypothetical protein
MSWPTSASGVAEGSAPLRCWVSPALKLHLVMDNYGTHKEPHVQAWLKTHPRFVRHFVDLKQAIEAFMQAWNQNLKPFIWSATVEGILKKTDRARVKMEQIKPGSTRPGGKKKTVDL